MKQVCRISMLFCAAVILGCLVTVPLSAQDEGGNAGLGVPVVAPQSEVTDLTAAPLIPQDKEDIVGLGVPVDMSQSEVTDLTAAPSLAQNKGAIVGWGEYVVVSQSDLTRVVSIAAGYYHSLGLKADGSIVAWGSNAYGQCNVPVPNSNFIAIAAGGYHSLGSEGRRIDRGLGIQPVRPMRCSCA